MFDAVQRRAIRLIGDPALTCHLQPLSHRRAVGDLSLFYRYSTGFCSSELTSIIPPLSKPARCTRGTSSSHPKAVVLHTSRTLRFDRTFIPRVSRAWNGLPDAIILHTSRTERYDRTFVLGCLVPRIDCLVMYVLSLQVLAYSNPASTNFP
nr:unnamed protein product [Callosobruchus chinensis]